MNNSVIIGRNVREVDLKFIPGSNIAVANFTVAVDRGMSKEKKQEAEAQGKQTTDFIRVVAFNKQAEFIANNLEKGKLVGVQGKIQTGSYDDKDGKKVYTTEILAQNVEMLEWPNREQSSPNTSSDPAGFHPTDDSEIPF